LTCKSGALAQGISCLGPQCDKKLLLCRRFSDSADLTATHQWSQRVSAQDSNTESTDEGAFVSAFQDDDNTIRLRYSTSELIANSALCSWQNASSPPYELVCPAGHFISGISCSGDYCQDISLYCCQAILPEADVSDEGADTAPTDSPATTKE
jgi:hypothetical protein